MRRPLGPVLGRTMARVCEPKQGSAIQGGLRTLGLSAARGWVFSRSGGVHPMKRSRAASFHAAVDKTMHRCGPAPGPASPVEETDRLLQRQGVERQVLRHPGVAPPMGDEGAVVAGLEPHRRAVPGVAPEPPQHLLWTPGAALSELLVRDEGDGPVEPDREHVLVGGDGGVGVLVAQPRVGYGWVLNDTVRRARHRSRLSIFAREQNMRPFERRDVRQELRGKR